MRASEFVIKSLQCLFVCVCVCACIREALKELLCAICVWGRYTLEKRGEKSTREGLRERDRISSMLEPLCIVYCIT